MIDSTPKTCLNFQAPNEEQMEEYKRRLASVSPEFVRLIDNQETFVFLSLGRIEENEDCQITRVLYGQREELQFLLLSMLGELDRESLSKLVAGGIGILMAEAELAAMPVQGEA